MCGGNRMEFSEISYVLATAYGSEFGTRQVEIIRFVSNNAGSQGSPSSLGATLIYLGTC